MILPAMLITFISTQLNTGTYNKRLIGHIRHFTAMSAMEYMRMIGLERWIVRCWNMIDALSAWAQKRAHPTCLASNTNEKYCDDEECYWQ